jgi:hypothetical protein
MQKSVQRLASTPELRRTLLRLASGRLSRGPRGYPHRMPGSGFPTISGEAASTIPPATCQACVLSVESRL